MTKKKVPSSELSDTSKGRKTKGGKLISKKSINLPSELPVGNIILHLKCSFSDLEKYNENYNKQLTDPLLYIPAVPPELQTYDTMASDLHFNFITNTPSVEESYPHPVLKDTGDYAYINLCCQCKKSKPAFIISESDELVEREAGDENGEDQTGKTNSDEQKEKDDIFDMSAINQKLKTIKSQLIRNKITDKKSACFWCSYDFDNPECYIPTYEVDNTVCGYGSFCRPECAVAYLMKEQIDDSTKFERYNLINQIYGKIYNYNKNIKPAPNPFYLLDKYYGNLTIEEYRKLLKSNHLLMLVEKPLTRVFPELHEEMDDFSLVNGVGGGTNFISSTKSVNEYKVKRSSDKKNEKSKSSIIHEHFGLS